MKPSFKVWFLIVIACFVFVVSCPTARSQESKAFPTDEEIRLVITQTDRAVAEYVVTVEQERKLYGNRVDVENDNKVIDGLKLFSKKMGAQPNFFNSPFGFDFVLMLDDASRNAALCSGGAITEGVKATLAGQTQMAQDYLQLSQSCTSVSTLLYTVSENAAALYRRYVNGEGDLAQKAFDEMNKCVAVLKQQKTK